MNGYGWRCGIGPSVALAVVACSASDLPHSVAVSDSAGIEVARPDPFPTMTDDRFLWAAPVELTIPIGGHDPTDEPLIFDPVAVLPLSGDTVLVTDRFGDEVFVILDMARSEVIARFGRRGRGPEEISGGTRIVPVEGGGWLVFDAQNRKVLTYSPALHVVSENAIDFPGSHLRSGTLGDRVVLSEILRPTPGGYRWEVVHVAADGRLHLLFELPRHQNWSPQGQMTIQDGRPLWVGVGMQIVALRTDLPRIDIFSGEGSLIRRLELPISRRTLTDQDIEQQVRMHGPMARFLRPDSMALTNEVYAVDDSTFGTFQSSLWRAAEDVELPPGKVVWRLLSTSGTYRGVLELPDGFTALAADRGRLWGTRIDSDGMPVLERRRLERPVPLSH